MGQKSETKPPSLETAIERINAIVAEMEVGTLPLETLIARYEEGLGLVKTCQEKLDAAEKRIQIISRDAQGRASLTDFDAPDNAQ